MVQLSCQRRPEKLALFFSRCLGLAAGFLRITTMSLSITFHGMSCLFCLVDLGFHISLLTDLQDEIIINCYGFE